MQQYIVTLVSCGQVVLNKSDHKMFDAYKSYSVDTEACILKTITTDNFNIFVKFWVSKKLRKKICLIHWLSLLQNPHQSFSCTFDWPKNVYH